MHARCVENLVVKLVPDENRWENWRGTDVDLRLSNVLPASGDLYEKRNADGKLGCRYHKFRWLSIHFLFRAYYHGEFWRTHEVSCSFILAGSVLFRAPIIWLPDKLFDFNSPTIQLVNRRLVVDFKCSPSFRRPRESFSWLSRPAAAAPDGDTFSCKSDPCTVQMSQMR